MKKLICLVVLSIQLITSTFAKDRERILFINDTQTYSIEFGGWGSQVVYQVCRGKNLEECGEQRAFQASKFNYNTRAGLDVTKGLFFGTLSLGATAAIIEAASMSGLTFLATAGDFCLFAGGFTLAAATLSATLTSIEMMRDVKDYEIKERIMERLNRCGNAVIQSNDLQMDHLLNDLEEISYLYSPASQYE